MNKKQLGFLWFALVVFATMVWFPGEWFGYIIRGYPVLKPESVEFVIRILLPFCACVFLIVYSLRDRNTSLKMASQGISKQLSKSAVIKSTLILSCGALLGFLLGFVVIRYQGSTESTIPQEVQWVKAPQNDFKDFCRRESYKHELETLMDWVHELQAEEIAILYNGEDSYASDLYKYFSENIRDDMVTVAYSEMFKQGQKSFYSVLQDIKSRKPEAIIFLGNSEDRIAFLQNIADQPQEEFWKEKLTKIKWME